MALTFPTNLCSYTDEMGATFPAYFRIDAEGKRVEITVRAEQEDKQPGRTAVIEIPRATFHKLLIDAKLELDRHVLRGA